MKLSSLRLGSLEWSASHDAMWKLGAMRVRLYRLWTLRRRSSSSPSPYVMPSSASTGRTYKNRRGPPGAGAVGSRARPVGGTRPLLTALTEELFTPVTLVVGGTGVLGGVPRTGPPGPRSKRVIAPSS